MNTVVYYPHIYPTAEWLKLAALCWDQVYRLVPRRGPGDPKSIRELNSVLGNVLQPAYPADIGASPALRDQFNNWLTARAEQLRAVEWTLDEQTLVEFFPSKFPGGGNLSSSCTIKV